MVYGEPDSFTYIFESMASGCAFIDYDNDGWMDIFILCGRRLKDTPPNASNRLYKNNRDGTFSDVTAIAGLLDTGWLRASAWATITTTALKISSSPTMGRIASIATTATEPLRT